MPNIVVEGRKGDGEESNSAEMKIQNIEVNTNSYRRSSEGNNVIMIATPRWPI